MSVTLIVVGARWELCLLSELRTALRSGAVWVEGSRRYQPADRYLIAPAAWPARRDAARRMLGLPASVDERLELLARDLDERVTALDRALATGDVALDVQDGELGRTPLGVDCVGAAPHYACQLVLPTAKRQGSVLPRSHKDSARKAFEKLTKKVLPGSYAQLQRALSAEAKTYRQRVDELDRPAGVV